MKRLLFLTFLASVSLQLNAGYYTTSRLAEAIVPAGFVVVGGVVQEPATVVSGLIGAAMVGIRKYADSQGVNCQELEIGTKIVQVALPLFWACHWYNEKDATKLPDGLTGWTLERYKSMANLWFKIDVPVTFAEAALQIFC
jgi:hypothetical protein